MHCALPSKSTRWSSVHVPVVAVVQLVDVVVEVLLDRVEVALVETGDAVDFEPVVGGAVLGAGSLLEFEVAASAVPVVVESVVVPHGVREAADGTAVVDDPLGVLPGRTADLLLEELDHVRRDGNAAVIAVGLVGELLQVDQVGQVLPCLLDAVEMLLRHLGPVGPYLLHDLGAVHHHELGRVGGRERDVADTHHADLLVLRGHPDIAGIGGSGGVDFAHGFSLCRGTSAARCLVCCVTNNFVFAVAYFRRWQGASDEQWQAPREEAQRRQRRKGAAQTRRYL